VTSSAPVAPVRRVSRRTGAPPCDPDTLGPVCAGTCGRPLHARPPKGGCRRACTDGHPVIDTGDQCASCSDAWRLANPELVQPRRRSKRAAAAGRGDPLSYCTHDEGEPGCHCGEAT
jgi:hypothetical protein